MQCISTEPKNLCKMIFCAWQKVKLLMILMEQKFLSTWVLLRFSSIPLVHDIKILHFSQNIIHLKDGAFPSISIIDIRKDSFSHDINRVMLLCRSQNSPLTSFYNTLKNVLSDSFIDIVLCDFNIDVLNSISIILMFGQIIHLSEVHLPGETTDMECFPKIVKGWTWPF